MCNKYVNQDADMDQLATSLKRYLKATLDIDARPEQWSGKGKLPI